MLPERKETREINNERLISSKYFDTKELYELLYKQNLPNEKKKIQNLSKSNHKITNSNSSLKSLHKLQKSKLKRSDTF